MKKSMIINMSSNKIDELGLQLENYLPKEDAYEKITTFGSTDYDYIYITNFKKNSVEKFASLFQGKEEAFFIQNDSYTNEELENIYVAYEKSNYAFKRDKNYKEKHSAFEFISDNDTLEASKIIANAISTCKDLINMPSNELTTNSFAKFLKDMAAECDMNYSELNKDDLIKLGAGGILAVNQGSLEEAKIVTLEYRGNKQSDKKYTMVGKGLIFDTGGYSLKPTASMVAMKSDMGGAASCSAVIKAVAKLKLNINMDVVIPITDNLVNEKSYRPDDIITFMNGLTTEITSTDAEGRLILADALVIANKSKPELIIDMATLTGAVVASLGTKTTGLFGNDKENIENIIRCCESNEEYAWQLPINDTHREQIKGNIATLKNSASPAGASTAAAFLENFVDDTKWIHIDIAGTSFDSTTGATGAMVRPLVKFFSEIKE